MGIINRILGVDKAVKDAVTTEVDKISQAHIVEVSKITEIHTAELVKVNESHEIQLKAASSSPLLGTNFNAQIFPNYQAQRQNLVYQKTDDIYSVVSRLASIAAMIPLYGEGKDKTDLKETDKLNIFVDSLSFDKKYIYYLHKLIDGEIFAYKDIIELGVNKGLKGITPLVPSAMVVNTERLFPYAVVSYTYYNPVYGDIIYFAKEDIIFNKSYNPSLDRQEIERGLSPVRVLCRRLTRVDASLDISVAQMQNGGTPGWLYLNAPNMAGQDAAGILNQHKENYARYSNNRSNKGAPYIAGGEWGYVSIGSTLADLDLAQLSDIDFDKICNVWSVSSTLFNNKKASTESNVKEMVTAMYTNAIMPLVISFVDTLNQDVVPDIDTKGRICSDFSDVAELQTAMVEKAKALGQLPVMCPNDVLEAIGFDRVKDDELMDKFYIKTGYVPIDEMGLAAPLPNTAGDYGEAPVVPLKAAGK